jgi:hypothetical protein
MISKIYFGYLISDIIILSGFINKNNISKIIFSYLLIIIYFSIKYNHTQSVVFKENYHFYYQSFVTCKLYQVHLWKKLTKLEINNDKK